MTFSANEASRNAARPLHLYEFVFSDGSATIRYTNVAQGWWQGGNEYLPLAITHGEIVASGDLDKSTFEVVAPEDSTIAAAFAQGGGSNVVTLILRQGHVTEDDFKVAWSGTVLGATFGDNDVTLSCEPVTVSMRRTGLTRDYQFSCPLTLYGNKCRVVKATATSTATVTSVDGAMVTLPAAWAATDLKDKHIGGIAEWTVAGRIERRSIINHAADVLTLGSAATDLAAAATITLILGCNHQLSDCENLHNNIQNFGGQPEIPLKNPIGITNSYY
jgi:hypothetical protein